MSVERPGPDLHRYIALAGVALTMVAIGWWAIVYAQVLVNTGMSPAHTVPCLIYTTDRCSLAMALCKEWHILGIQRYSAELLWIGAALCAAALLFDRRPPADSK